MNGVKTPKECDVGDHFNLLTSDCDTIANAQCTLDRCINSSDTAPYVPDPAVDDCTQYFVCNAKITVDYRICATGLFFDVDQQRCSSKFVCAKNF